MIMGFKKYFFLIFFFALSAHARPVQFKNIIVSGPSSYLAETVRQIYKKGGNVFDAAVAGAFTLSVTHPYFVSLGAGGFAVLKTLNDVTALDFRETAPGLMKKDFYTAGGLSSQRGGSAAAVPGFTAGMYAIHQKYGSLSWVEIIKPALKLSRRGFIVSGQWTERTKKYKDEFDIQGKKIFFHSSGRVYQPGEILKQPRLTKALKLIQRKKLKVFYEGPIGRDIVQAVKENKGLMTMDDLKAYQPRWLKPFQFSFKNYKAYTMPLPSSGGIILARAFKLAYHTNIFKEKLYSLNESHLLAEILKLSFRPRGQMGDLAQPYVKHWLKENSLKLLSRKISLKRAKKWPALKENLKLSLSVKKEPGETTHFSLMDKEGRALSMTLTLNGNFGSFVTTKKYGIILNNQMDDFNTRPGQPNQFGLIQGVNNQVKGGKRPLSSMSPVIVTNSQGTAVMALGGAGGPMIISSVFQVMYRYLINGLNLDLSLQAPRLHHQFLPRLLYFEKNRFSPLLLKFLKKKGHSLKERSSIAKVYAVSRKPNKEALLEGAFDARGEGFSAGL